MNTLSSAVWPGITDAPTVLVPIGSIEQHGPHLPLDTDAAIATAVAYGAAEVLVSAGNSVWVAPPLAYGSSGEHQAFPGTCSIGSEALRLVLVELTRSLRCWAASVVFINAHGGNINALSDAVSQLTYEGHDVTWLACATEEVDLHAGRTETSLMLHLRPSDVRLDHAEVGNTSPLKELLPMMLEGGIKAVSPNGVLGDPAGASAEEGGQILASMVDDVVRAIKTKVPAW